MSIWIKICGITRVEDAIVCAKCGVDAIGLNFAPSSPRSLDAERAAQIARAFREESDHAHEVIGVFVDAGVERVFEIAERVGLDAAQLHGQEAALECERAAQALRSIGVQVFKAVRIGSSEDAVAALAFPGDRILADAKVKGALGGTGQTFDWELVTGLNRVRRLILAGGLRVENVTQAVERVHPYGVDTASGVEREPGIKDPARIRAFVANARRAIGK